LKITFISLTHSTIFIILSWVELDEECAGLKLINIGLVFLRCISSDHLLILLQLWRWSAFKVDRFFFFLDVTKPMKSSLKLKDDNKWERNGWKNNKWELVHKLWLISLDYSPSLWFTTMKVIKNLPSFMISAFTHRNFMWLWKSLSTFSLPFKKELSRAVRVDRKCNSRKYLSWTHVNIGGKMSSQILWNWNSFRMSAWWFWLLLVVFYFLPLKKGEKFCYQFI
jgi:hypothetical protein